ncbi:MAG TPA: histidine kinase dimerization/phosphoacceptor domain -containing protein [Alkalispirochaeta sp.]|nr:histidine kinase dimerization/phosphoacceptor domain -containing protein [Alkalispirochaeta sp.]
MTRVLFAINNPAEQSLFQQVISTADFPMDMMVPANISEADAAIRADTVDVIVTDFAFHNGGFAEWLFLWQHPFVILADWDQYERVREIISDQTSDFAIRDGELRHIRFLPLVIRKLLNSREAIERHNITLRMTEERYRELVQALPDIVYSLDDAGRFVFINDSVQRLGWNPVELIGKHFSVILDPEDIERVSRAHVLRDYKGQETGDEHAPKLFDERRTGERRTRDLLVKLQHKDDPANTTDLFGSVIAYGEVNAVGFISSGSEFGEPGSVGIIRDVSQRQQAEEIVRRSLHEKETLLSEIHHRVKNNLQVISSLLNLHAGTITDPAALSQFVDAQMQIQSMALVHEHLYQNESFERVDIHHYVTSLCRHLYDVYGASEERIALDIDIEPISITMQQAMPVALLLNELVSNSLKYAFPDETTGAIHVRIYTVGADEVEVRVEDDGVGLPEDFDIASSLSLGHTLIYSLAHQLDGTVELDGDGGTRFTLRFTL